MGTWAVDSFGNDSAGDWIIDLKENPTYEFIRETLEACIDYPNDSMSNENAIAAAEVLCILKGIIPSNYHGVEHNLTPAIDALKELQQPNDLKFLALQAVDQIEKDSELKELWEGDEEWISELKSLRKRLQSERA